MEDEGVMSEEAGELAKALAKVRAYPGFLERLARRIEEDKALLDKLKAQEISSPLPTSRYNVNLFNHRKWCEGCSGCTECKPL